MSKKDRKRDQPFARPSALVAQHSSFWWGYGAGAALCLAGLVLLSVALGQVLRTTTRGIYRLEAPGAAALSLRKPGLYVGFYQHKGRDPLPLQELGALEVTAQRENGAPLSVERGAGPQPFAARGQQGAILFQFEAPAAGRYALNIVSPLPGAAKREILVIHESLQTAKADIFAGIVLCLVLGGFGVYVLLRTRKAAQRAAGVAGPPPK